MNNYYKKRKVIISATCHGEVIQALFLKSPSFTDRYECEFIPNYQVGHSGIERASIALLLNKLSNCDILIYHDALGISHSSLLEYLPSHAATIVIPYPTTLIYWPGHSLNPIWLIKERGASVIPFPCLVLNNIIMSYRDKSKILEEYLNLDFSQHVDMDNILTNQIQYLKTAQRNSPLDVATYVANYFNNKRLFHLPNHPSSSLFEFMTNGLLEILGCKSNVSLDTDLFEGLQTPIHPSVIKYFDLKWCRPDTIYNLWGRRLNFEAYVRLYIDAFMQQNWEANEA